MPPKPGNLPAIINSNTEFFVYQMCLLNLESVNIIFIGIASNIIYMIFYLMVMQLSEKYSRIPTFFCLIYMRLTCPQLY